MNWFVLWKNKTTKMLKAKFEENFLFDSDRDSSSDYDQSDVSITISDDNTSSSSDDDSSSSTTSSSSLDDETLNKKYKLHADIEQYSERKFASPFTFINPEAIEREDRNKKHRKRTIDVFTKKRKNKNKKKKKKKKKKKTIKVTTIVPSDSESSTDSDAYY